LFGRLRQYNQVQVICLFCAAVKIDGFFNQVKAADSDKPILFVSQRNCKKIAGAKMLPPAFLVKQLLERRIGYALDGQIVPFGSKPLKGFDADV
jgi:hypothetical protein